ncbi:MAG: hypothetical protein ACI9AR_000462, partial [Flavobacteriaceae bacterium]
WEQDSQNLGCSPRAGRVWEGMPADFGISFFGWGLPKLILQK